MQHCQFLRIKKLLPKNIIQVAAKHNLREILAEIGSDGHIDPNRTASNRILRGPDTAAAVAHLAQALMDNSGIKALRKDAVRGLEIIFGLPAQSGIDESAFFNDAVRWAESYFDVPIISAVVHNDEDAPHCHVVLLPLSNGRMIGSDLMGNRTRLHAMQTAFHAQVACRYGLARQMAPARFNATVRRQAAEQAFAAIADDPGMFDSPDFRHCLQDLIAANPEPLMLLLGLQMPNRPQRKQTFVGVMIKPVKPENPIGFQRPKPIGFAAVASGPNHQTLSCVGFASETMPIDAADDQSTDDLDASNDDFIRERDADLNAGWWDETRGEFVRYGTR